MGRRLGINLVFLNPDRTGGAETYAHALLREFHSLDLGVDLPVVLFVGRNHRLEVDPQKFQLVECEIDPRHQYRRIIWEQTHLPKILHAHRLDLVHFPYSAYPIRYRGRCVVSVHDTTRFVAPKGVPKAQIWYRQVMEARLRENSHHVICVSHADAAILQQHLLLPDSQLSVVHHGVSDSFRTETPYDGPRSYLLWAGRPYEHKRLDTLLAAHKLLGPARPLLRLIGITGTLSDLNDRVSVEPPIPHSQLPDIFGKAIAFVFPSSYESFGLPAVEAMAAGTPVVCSDIPAFQELYANVAQLTTTGSPEALAAGLRTVLSDPTLQRTMSQAGIQHASQFTWRRCAGQTLSIYHRLLATGY